MALNKSGKSLFKVDTKKELLYIQKSLRNKLSQKKLDYLKSDDYYEDHNVHFKKSKSLLISSLYNRCNNIAFQTPNNGSTIMQLDNSKKSSISKWSLADKDNSKTIDHCSSPINNTIQKSENCSLLVPSSNTSPRIDLRTTDIKVQESLFNPNLKILKPRCKPVLTDDQKNKVKKLVLLKNPVYANREKNRTLKKSDLIYDSIDDLEDDVEGKQYYLEDYSQYPSEPFIYFLSPISVFMNIWNIITFILIAYSQLFLLMSLSFDLEFRIKSERVACVLLEIYFICDVIITLRCSFFFKEELIENRRAIYINYFKNQFVWEFTRILPINSIVFLFPSINSSLKIFIVLTRFLQLTNSSHILKAINALEPFSHSLIKPFKLMYYVLFFFHVLTCLWILAAKLEDDLNWNNWIAYYGLTEQCRLDIYISSLYFMAVTILTTGYGDFVPKTLLEKFIIIVILFFGYILFSLTLSSLSTIVVSQSKKEQDFNDKCENLRIVSTKYSLKEAFAEKVRKVLANNYLKKNNNEHNTILETLPSSMKNEIITFTQNKLKKEYKFFKAISPNFVGEILGKLIYSTFNKNEIVVHYMTFLNEVYILQNGCFGLFLEPEYNNYKFACIMDRESFGEYLTLNQRKATFTVKAQTHSTAVMILPKEDILAFKYDFESQVDFLLEKSYDQFKKIQQKEIEVREYFDVHKNFDGYRAISNTKALNYLNLQIENEFNNLHETSKLVITEESHDQCAPQIYNIYYNKYKHALPSTKVFKENQNKKHIKRSSKPRQQRREGVMIHNYNKIYKEDICDLSNIMRLTEANSEICSCNDYNAKKDILINRVTVVNKHSSSNTDHIIRLPTKFRSSKKFQSEPRLSFGKYTSFGLDSIDLFPNNTNNSMPCRISSKAQSSVNMRRASIFNFLTSNQTRSIKSKKTTTKKRSNSLFIGKSNHKLLEDFVYDSTKYQANMDRIKRLMQGLESQPHKCLSSLDPKITKSRSRSLLKRDSRMSNVRLNKRESRLEETQSYEIFSKLKSIISSTQKRSKTIFKKKVTFCPDIK